MDDRRPLNSASAGARSTAQTTPDSFQAAGQNQTQPNPFPLPHPPSTSHAQLLPLGQTVRVEDRHLPRSDSTSRTAAATMGHLQMPQSATYQAPFSAAMGNQETNPRNLGNLPNPFHGTPGNLAQPSMFPLPIRSPPPRYLSVTRSKFQVGGIWDVEKTKYSGSMYVEKLEPQNTQDKFSTPLVLIHGDYHDGSLWLNKPDGQAGWADYFVAAGFTVYIPDLPFHGRSNLEHHHLSDRVQYLEIDIVENEITAPEKCRMQNPAYSAAKKHTQWPGTGTRGDPIFDRYLKSLCPEYFDRRVRQGASQQAMYSLMSEIGPGVLIGQGMGGNIAMMTMDACPNLVLGVVAVEPTGPPFASATKLTDKGQRVHVSRFDYVRDLREYGFCDLPVNFDIPPNPPRLVEGMDEWDDGMDLNRLPPLPVHEVYVKERNAWCFLQDGDLILNVTDCLNLQGQMQEFTLKNPVRKLRNLEGRHVAIVTGEASPHALYDWATALFLKQAGVRVQHIELERRGIHGNGHLCFLEKNSDNIASLVFQWILHTVHTVVIDAKIGPRTGNMLGISPLRRPAGTSDQMTVSNPPGTSKQMTVGNPLGTSDHMTIGNLPGKSDQMTFGNPLGTSDHMTIGNLPGKSDQMTFGNPPGTSDQMSIANPPGTSKQMAGRNPPGISDQMTVCSPPELGGLTPTKTRRQSTGSWSATKTGTTVTFHQKVKSDQATGRGDSRSISLGSMPAQYGPPPAINKPAAPTGLGTPTPVPQSHMNPFTMMAPPSLSMSFDMMSISANQATQDLSASLVKDSQFPTSDLRHTSMTFAPTTGEKRPDSSGAAVAGNIVEAQNQVMAHFTPALGQHVPVPEKTAVSQAPIMQGGQPRTRPNLIQTPFNQAPIPAPKLIPMVRDPTSWTNVPRLPNPGPIEQKQQPAMGIGGPGRLRPSGEVVEDQEELDDDFDLAAPLPQSSRSKKEELEDEDYTPPSSRRTRPRGPKGRARKGSTSAQVDDAPDVVSRAPAKAQRATGGGRRTTKKTVRFESPTPASTTQAPAAMNPSQPSRAAATPSFVLPPSNCIPEPVPQSALFALAPSGTSSSPSSDAYAPHSTSIPPPSPSAAPVNRTSVHTPEKRADAAGSSSVGFQTRGLPETPPSPTPLSREAIARGADKYHRGTKARRAYFARMDALVREAELAKKMQAELTGTTGGEPSRGAETENGIADASGEGAGLKRKRAEDGKNPQTEAGDESQDMPSEMPDPKRQK